MMRRFIPQSIFGRLFSLILIAIVASHLMIAGIVFLKFGRVFPSADIDSRPHGSPSGRSPETQPVSEGQVARQKTEHVREPIQLPPAPPPEGMIVILAIQLLTLTLAAWYGARVLARPIQRLAYAAAELGDNLNAPPILEEGPIEARQAAKIFNDMQERVRSQVLERERFLAAVSHDLRTPLTRMKLRTGRLADNIVKEKLHADIAEMATMLDATLNYIRGKSSHEAWQILDVQALIDSMVEDAREVNQAVSVSGAALPLLTQPMALRSCLTNLVENALRYGQVAKIYLIDTPDTLLIEVRDEGPGIPPDKMAVVLEPFVRLESSRNKAFGGVGLGLAIANDAAELCGGSLALRNAEGGGLIASISLPRSRP